MANGKTEFIWLGPGNFSQNGRLSPPGSSVLLTEQAHQDLDDQKRAALLPRGKNLSQLKAATEEPVKNGLGDHKQDDAFSLIRACDDLAQIEDWIESEKRKGVGEALVERQRELLQIEADAPKNLKMR